MTDLLSRRNVTWAVRVAVVVAVVLAVFLLRGGDDGETPSGAPSGVPSQAPTSEPTRASPDEFCSAFRAFADANALYVGAPDTATGEALLTAATTLAGLEEPLGLSPGGEVSLDQLVAGSLEALGESIEVRDDVAPDQAAFDAYLTTTCPA